ncbi:MAG: tagaturonate epimerase family protein [Spirochaetota bacterium]
MEINKKDLENWLQAAKKAGILTSNGLCPGKLSEIPGADSLLYPGSVFSQMGAVYAMVKIGTRRLLGIFLQNGVESNFEGQKIEMENGGKALFCPLSRTNASALRMVLPHTAPSSLARQKVTFGMGDRLGVAGPGQVRAIRPYEAAPVLAQQSVRELELTGRSYEEVLDSATWSVFQEGYTLPWGADGDHLKTESWVQKAISLGYTMITADVSDYIHQKHNSKPKEEMMKAYSNLDKNYRRKMENKYLNLRVELDVKKVITFTLEELACTILTYKEALEQAGRLYQAGVQKAGGRSFDFELSVDETSMPTTPQAHIFAALECQEAGIYLSSLAPRFVGEFQKGIDYIGELSRFGNSFRIHAAIARKYGHRISIHSGSDKFTVFPVISRHTRGRFHLKTAGTNWLEALRVIARKEPALYRTIHHRAMERFDKATRYYHVTTDLGNIPAVNSLSDKQLSGLFDNPDARQLLHITYGELLSDSSLKKSFFSALERHLEDYWACLEKHLGDHLKLLGVQKD